MNAEITRAGGGSLDLTLDTGDVVINLYYVTAEGSTALATVLLEASLGLQGSEE